MIVPTLWWPITGRTVLESLLPDGKAPAHVVEHLMLTKIMKRDGKRDGKHSANASEHAKRESRIGALMIRGQRNAGVSRTVTPGYPTSRPAHLVMRKEHANTLAMMDATNRLGKDVRHLQHL